jgi:hypothetical protein
VPRPAAGRHGRQTLDRPARNSHLRQSALARRAPPQPSTPAPRDKPMGHPMIPCAARTAHGVDGWPCPRQGLRAWCQRWSSHRTHTHEAATAHLQPCTPAPQATNYCSIISVFPRQARRQEGEARFARVWGPWSECTGRRPRLRPMEPSRHSHSAQRRQMQLPVWHKLQVRGASHSMGPRRKRTIATQATAEQQTLPALGEFVVGLVSHTPL